MTATASCAASPTSGRPSPTPPSAPPSSSATPARPSATTTSCSSSSPRRSSTGPASSRYSREDGTHAAGLDEQVPAELALERLRECAELQDAITAAKRDALIGATRQVLVDAPGQGRTVHEAPEIDGIVHLPDDLAVGSLVDLTITGAEGPDLFAVPPPIGIPVARRWSGSAVSEATHEPGIADELHLRPERAGHAGQRGHGGPPAGGARLRADARGLGRLVDQRRRGLPARGQRRARWLHGPPPRHDPLGRLPRPPGRQGRACSPP